MMGHFPLVLAADACLAFRLTFASCSSVCVARAWRDKSPVIKVNLKAETTTTTTTNEDADDDDDGDGGPGVTEAKRSSAVAVAPKPCARPPVKPKTTPAPVAARVAAVEVDARVRVCLHIIVMRE
eukprot:COSAG05_NODE_322_length_11414_cov_47.115510_7_plen_125_part_00